MKRQRLSPLGYLMEHLNIPTVSLARELHVDASLVSKWKSGDRCLNSKSMYFDEIVLFLLKESERSENYILRNALAEIYPFEDINQSSSLAPFIHQLLSNQKLTVPIPANTVLLEAGTSVQIQLFEQNQGRRQAIDRILTYAENMPKSGRIIIIDSEEYGWLLEDEAFAKSFATRINKLLLRGFTARFVIHFSSYRERFVRFFESCNLLIFHRNIEWYYYEYYDENIFHSSFFILDKALSLLGLASSALCSSTMIFSDTPSVIQHSLLAESVISHCQRLFINFPPTNCRNVVDYIRVIRKRGTLYAYLPAPAFVSADTDLLREILLDNQIPTAAIEHCLSVNRLMRDIVKSQFKGLSNCPERIVQIFQLEEMTRRVNTVPFISCSLTLLGGQEVDITKEQYARCILHLADSLYKYDNMEIAFVSEKDKIPLPNIPEMNCWCKQNTWMVQMDREGFRLSDEISIVNAASVTLERCLRKIPPERKEKDAVHALLKEFASDICR